MKKWSFSERLSVFVALVQLLRDEGKVSSSILTRMHMVLTQPSDFLEENRETIVAGLEIYQDVRAPEGLQQLAENKLLAQMAKRGGPKVRSAIESIFGAIPVVDEMAVRTYIRLVVVFAILDRMKSLAERGQLTQRAIIDLTDRLQRLTSDFSSSLGYERSLLQGLYRHIGADEANAQQLCQLACMPIVKQMILATDEKSELMVAIAYEMGWALSELEPEIRERFRTCFAENRVTLGEVQRDASYAQAVIATGSFAMQPTG